MTKSLTVGIVLAGALAALLPWGLASTARRPGHSSLAIGPSVQRLAAVETAPHDDGDDSGDDGDDGDDETEFS
jgi:hypothetical protein